jgi:hypothetical protein
MRAVSAIYCALASALGCVAPLPAPAGVERGVLGFLYEGDTTVIEEYTRSANVLEGIVRPQGRGAKFGWARYRVELGPSGNAERAVLQLGRRSDESTPVRTWTVTIAGTEVVEVSGGDTTRRRRADRGVVPLFPPSMAMFHEVIRQAHRQRGAGSGRTDVPIFDFPGSGEIHHATVEWPARDTAAVSYYGGPVTLYAVDARGRVLSARDPRDGRHLMVRVR